jgi:hypothetical protein
VPLIKPAPYQRYGVKDACSAKGGLYADHITKKGYGDKKVSPKPKENEFGIWILY